MRKILLASVFSALLGSSLTVFAQQAHWQQAIGRLSEAIHEASYCEKSGTVNVKNCAPGRQQAIALMQQALQLLKDGQGR